MSAPSIRKGRAGQDPLQSLPAVGPSIATDLRRLGVRSVADLARRDPERLYARLNALTGVRQDPCVLYTFRCAVYAARTPRPRAHLLKWWNWKDRRLEAAGRRAGGPAGRRS
jgi:Pathogenicity locus